MNDDQVDQVLIRCAAQDHVLAFSAFRAQRFPNRQAESSVCYISTLEDLFYSKQQSMIRKIWDRLFHLIKIARGKEYELYDLVVYDAPDLRKMADFFDRAATEAECWDLLHES